jgi:transposase
VGRPKKRFVPIKSDDQLDLQSHRVRERWVMRRTAAINQIRGLLLECGITLRQGRGHVDAALPGIADSRSGWPASKLLRDSRSAGPPGRSTLSKLPARKYYKLAEPWP